MNEMCVEDLVEYMFKCNIMIEVNYVMEGFKIVLNDTRELRFEVFGVDVVFEG